jgi:hypothetical protein
MGAKSVTVILNITSPSFVVAPGHRNRLEQRLASTRIYAPHYVCSPLICTETTSCQSDKVTRVDLGGSRWIVSTVEWVVLSEN